MGFQISQSKAVPLWFIIEQREIIEEAKRLRDRAALMGMQDEVTQIIAPRVKRGRGRQPGSHSEALARSRSHLLDAYEAEKAKSPGTMEEISRRLHARGIGNSPEATKALIAKAKAERASLSMTLLGAAGQAKKRGRPKKK
jgi:hypothetical protein